MESHRNLKVSFILITGFAKQNCPHSTSPFSSHWRLLPPIPRAQIMLIWRERAFCRASAARVSQTPHWNSNQNGAWMARAHIFISADGLRGAMQPWGWGEACAALQWVTFRRGDFQNQIRQAAADYNCRKVNTKGKRDGLRESLQFLFS